MRKQFYQTPLGNCYGLKLPKCWPPFKNKFIVLFIVIFGTLSGSSLRQTVHTHRASVHQAAKLVAALLRVARVTAGLAESNGSLPPGL